MRFRLSWVFRPRSQTKVARRAASVRPRLEALEDRLTPALTYHGGAILANVQTQAVYLGSAWAGAPVPSSVFDAFLNTTVSTTAAGPAPYLAMLHNAGFTGVTGDGHALAGFKELNATVPATITDAQIQTALQLDVTGRKVQSPDVTSTASPLYFVYVQPGSVVSLGNGKTSVNTFEGYHSSFAGTDAHGAAVPIRYAVIPFHGTAGNEQDRWLDQQDSMTVVASHELAEAITDPDGTGYFDGSNNEVGDIVNGSTVYLHGYAVQREAAIPGAKANFLAMTPSGATPRNADKFTLQNGALAVHGAVVVNPSGETGKAVAVSQVGIDDFGQPLVDVVFSDANAYEYHDFAPGNRIVAVQPSYLPWTSLSGGVKQAVAGQGVSYVLLTNGDLGEYVDPNYTTRYYGYGVNPGARNSAIATGVTSINGVGLDHEGVNAVAYSAVVRGKAGSYEWRDVLAAATPLSTNGNPFNGTKYSEVPGTMGAFPGLTLATTVVIAAPPTPFFAPSVATVQPAAALSPATLPVPIRTVHAAFPDSGWSSRPSEEDAGPLAAGPDDARLG